MATSIINKKQKLDENGKEVRKVIKIVNDITVYAPTSEQYNYIEKFVESHVDKENNKVEISGEEVFRILYKELTDLQDIDKVDDGELKDIIEHPDEDLEEVNHILSNELTKLIMKMLDVKQDIINGTIIAIKGAMLQENANKLINQDELNVPKEIRDNLQKIEKISKNPLESSKK
ncbi:hypothetical protein ACFHWD_04100 [Clostridium sp. MT-14]|uniref:hypothetical protein n=1 Tax=Clostridium sp. MT-14 TaxID=3348360 RepID=UPI0035F3E9F6